MGVSAYILIQTEVGKAASVADEVRRLPGVIAGLMEFARLFGPGPAYYLPVIGMALSALGASSALCGFMP